MATLDFTEAPAPGASPQREFQISAYLQTGWRHRRLLLLGVMGGILAGLLVALATRPSFRASTVVDVERATPGPLVAGAENPPALDPQFLATETRLIAGREVAGLAAQKMNLAPAPGGTMDDVAEGIQGSVDVGPVRGTNLIEISAVARTPQRAADIANSVAQGYIDWKLDGKFRVANQLAQFLASQVAKTKADLSTREQQLLAFGKQKDILGTLEPQTNATLQKFETLNRDLAAATTDRLTKEARVFETRTAAPDTMADPSTAILIGQMRADQARLEREYSEKLSVFKPEWPAMQSLKTQIEQGRAHIAALTAEATRKVRDSARGEYQGALRREQSLREALAQQKNEAQAVGADAVAYNNLRVEVDAQKALLDNLLKRQADNAVTERLQGEKVSSVRVVEKALPPKSRFRPSFRNDALVGLFFGLVVGVGFVFAAEHLDRSIKSPEQAAELLRVPVLGIIPALEEAAPRYGALSPANPRKPRPSIELLPFEMPHTAVAEAYRALRTSLLLSRADGVRVFCVTSALPLEGKTSTAANLACVLGQLGRRVLIVDADLHKPRLHEVFRASNRPGLTSVLAERLDPASAVVTTRVPNVWLVGSGPSAPDPSGLLYSDAMTRFLDFARSEFDYVLIDTPPLLAVADSVGLGHRTDGVILCVKGGSTPREAAIRARDELLRSHVRILGVVLNDLASDLDVLSRRYYDAYHEPVKAEPRIKAARSA